MINNYIGYQIAQNFLFKNNKLEIKPIESSTLEIQLGKYFENFSLESLIIHTQEEFALYSKYLVNNLKNEKTQFPSSFQLDIQKDSIAKMKIDNPIKASLQQNLLLNPQFTNQKCFFENIIYNQNGRNFNPNDEFFEELLLTLLFWDIHKRLKQSYQEDSFQIYIYPNKCNFFIIRNEISPFFQSNQTKMINILLNTQTIKEINHELEINKEYQIELFDKHPSDLITNKGIIIQLKKYQPDAAKQQYNQVTPKSYYFIFSTLCECDEEDELMHIIEFSPSSQPKCQKCNIPIHPDDFETFYTKKGLYDIWEKGQLYLTQFAQFASPNFLLGNQYFQIINDKENQNLYVNFYQENEKVKNYDLDQELEQTQDSIYNSSNLQEIKQFQLLYKKLKVGSPYLNYNINVVNKQPNYNIDECLESD